MLPKPGKPLEQPKSYRPISLLPTISKVFEKNPLPQADGHYSRDSNHTRSSIRLSREACYAVEQVHRVTNIVLTALEEKEFCAAAFLDVSQVFDRM